MNLNAECLDMIDKFKSGEIEASELNDYLYDELVPGSGPADTVAGEILRAINRIGYRFYNDGDMAGVEYGKETVNPAVRYLVAKRRLEDRDNPFYSVVSDFFGFVDGDTVSNDEYQEALNELISTGLTYIIDKQLWNKPNTEDMLSFGTPEDKDTSWDDSEDDDWDSEEDY